MTFSTPGGRPACMAMSASSKHVTLAYSLGLSTTALPAARAGATFHTPTAQGRQSEVDQRN